jgi:hypothetical protein
LLAFFFRAVCGPGPSSYIGRALFRPFFLRVAIVTFPPVDNAKFILSLMCEGDMGITDRLQISRRRRILDSDLRRLKSAHQLAIGVLSARMLEFG